MFDIDNLLPPQGHPLSNSVERQIASHFQRHLKQTGEPETFPRVEIGRSDNDEFQLVHEFTLDRNHRGKRDKVPCSICTGHAPKFLQGWLAYFPKDRKFRLLGNTCGPKHFGDFSQQKSDLRRRQRSEERRAFLRENIEAAKAISASLDKVQNTAKMCDKFVAAIQRQTPSLYQALNASAGRTPPTYLVEKKEEVSIDLDTGRTRTERHAVSSNIEFFGWELFDSEPKCVESFAAVGRCFDAEHIAAAQDFLHHTEDVTTDFPAKWREARRNLANIEQHKEALVQFLSPQGISNFAAWMRRGDNPIQGSVSFSGGQLQVSINRLTKEQLSVRIPDSMAVRSAELPSFP